MTFSDWLKSQPRGAMARIEREAGVAHTTTYRASRGGRIGRFDVAKRISDATGGEVSVEELCASVSAEGAE